VFYESGDALGEVTARTVEHAGEARGIEWARSDDLPEGVLVFNESIDGLGEVTA
jgi:hypothetical protein